MSYKKAVIFLIVVSILVKLLFLFLSGAAYSKPQTFEYEQAAQNMLDGKGFYHENFGGTKYYAGIAPGFPVMCYIVYRIFGHHHMLIILIQVLVSSLIVLPISLIALKIFNEKTAVLAGALVALYPPFIVYSTTKLHTMNIYSFLFALFIWAFLALKDSVTPRRAILAGVVSGLAILFRITSLAFLFMAIIWFSLISRADIKKRVSAIVIAMVVSFFMLLPWGIRSYVIYGKPLLLQTNKGESFWYGNMPGSTGSLYTKGGKTLYETTQEKLPPEFFRMDEIEKDKYLRNITMGYFKEDPVSFIGRIIKKVFYFWYFSPYQGSLYPKLWMLLYKIYYLIIAPLALFSLVYNFFIKRKDWRDVSLIIFSLAALTAAHSLYFVEARHRWSVEPFVLIFTANGILIIIEYFSRLRERRPV